MLTLLIVIWPLFALIVLGFILRRAGFPGESFWPAAERFNYFLLFPVLLFDSLLRAPLNDPGLLRLGLAVLLVLGIGWLALLGLRRWRGWSGAHFGPLTQGVLRFNTYVGLAVAGGVYGEAGMAVAALGIALMVPLVNLLSVWSLTAGQGVGARALLLPIVKNPLILACVFGALANLAGLQLAGGLDRFFSLIAAASLPLGLLCVGASLQLRALGGAWQVLAVNCTARLLLMPVLAAVVAWALQLPALESSVLVLFFAIPTAPTAYILTRQLQGDGVLMASIITLQTLLAVITLPLVLAWL